MIGFIGGLFAGIFGLFDKLLPGKKKDYVVAFDDAVSTVQEKTKDVASTVQEKTQDVVSTVQEKTKDVASTVQEKTQDVASTVQSKTESATDKVASAKKAATSKKPKAEVKAKKRPTPKSEKKAQAAAKAQPKTPAPTTNGKVSTKPAQPVELFAPNYLLPKPTARRRRPGANMATFVQMSRDMNIRR